MPRLITLLLILASLAVLAMQNLKTALPLVILSSETAAIPVGILLVSAICTGALITLILYGLVGLGRPPESKYRPMGRRVPYPDSPGSTTLPPSGPATGSTGPSYGSGASAFVSDPPKDTVVKTPAAPASAPSVNAPTVTDSPIKGSTPKADTASSGAGTQGSKGKNTKANKSGGFRSHFGSRAPSAPIPENSPASTPRTNIDEAPGVKKKTKRKDKKRQEDTVNRKIGDDWGDLRTPEHRNSWEISEEERRQLGQPRGLFDFMKPGSTARENAGRLASDIAAGWSGRKGAQTSPQPNAASYQEGYQDSYNSYDQGDEDSYGRGPSYVDSRDGNYPSSGYQSGYQSEGYRPADYDDLDQGWENFDDYVEPPTNNVETERRVYGDSLYGEDSRDGGYGEDTYREAGYREGDYKEGDYREERFPEDGPNEIGPDGVYEADYRVIVPPSKPLDDESRDYDD